MNVTAQEADFAGRFDPALIGCVTAAPRGDDSCEIWAHISPDTEAADRALFRQWAAQRIARFIEHGPEPDGWACHLDDQGRTLWQLWARPQLLPDPNPPR